ncbi:MAG: hypothetical protein Roseis2KO_00650 [Roseivirga sp.]
MKRRRLIFAAGAMALTRPFKTLAGLLKPSDQTQDVSEAFYQLDDLEQQLTESKRRYLPFLNVETLRTGLYVLPAGTEDKQQPHEHDEVYYVISGRSKFIAGGKTSEAKAGSVFYVKAAIEHRFFDIEEELKVMVFFSNMN